MKKATLVFISCATLFLVTSCDKTVCYSCSTDYTLDGNTTPAGTPYCMPESNPSDEQASEHIGRGIACSFHGGEWTETK
jgi:hypothetical protein